MNATTKPIKLPTQIRTSEMLTSCLYDLIAKSKAVQPLNDAIGWNAADTLSQLLQEAGELSEQIMIREGKLPHKEAEPRGDFLESADTIICVVDALSNQNPTHSPAQILVQLAWAIDKKSDIWVEKVKKQHLDKISESGNIGT